MLLCWRSLTQLILKRSNVENWNLKILTCSKSNWRQKERWIVWFLFVEWALWCSWCWSPLMLCVQIGVWMCGTECEESSTSWEWFWCSNLEKLLTPLCFSGRRAECREDWAHHRGLWNGWLHHLRNLVGQNPDVQVRIHPKLLPFGYWIPSSRKAKPWSTSHRCGAQTECVINRYVLGHKPHDDSLTCNRGRRRNAGKKQVCLFLSACQAESLTLRSQSVGWACTTLTWCLKSSYPCNYELSFWQWN